MSSVEDRDAGWMVVQSRTAPSSKDPHYGVELASSTGVYEAVPSGSLELRTRVHHVADDSPLAMSCARGVASLMRLHRDRLGRPTLFPRSTPVAELWLVPRPAADPGVGGETRTSNVYLWDCRFRRSAQEWARTLAHEWGHLTLPAARGFASPEGDAAGHLGEALYMEWLAAETHGDESGDFMTPSVCRMWTERHNSPRWQRYQRLGPTDPDLERRDRSGMDAYVGAALGIGASFGSTTLGTVLRGIDNDSPRELFQSLRRHCAEQEQVLVKLPAWVPLPAGRFRIEGAPGNGILIVDGQRNRHASDAAGVRFARAGWHRIEAGPGQRTAASITRMNA
ncbi:MAG: hypothetical protein ACOVT5_07875 [Armatimonadaceae bacterium]